MISGEFLHYAAHHRKALFEKSATADANEDGSASAQRNDKGTA